MLYKDDLEGGLEGMRLNGVVRDHEIAMTVPMIREYFHVDIGFTPTI